MQNKLLRKFKFKKKENHFEHFALIIILVLLLCQILLFHSLTNEQSRDSYVSLVSESVDRLVFEEENTSGQMATLVASVASDPDVLSIVSGEGISELQSISLGSRIRKYTSLLGTVERIYLYRENSTRLIDLSEANNVLDNTATRLILDILSKKELEAGDSVIIPYENDRIGTDYRIMSVYNVDVATDDLLLVEQRAEIVRRSYDECQKNIRGRVIVCTEDGEVIYGGTVYKTSQNIKDEPIFKKLSDNKDYYVEDFMGEKSLIYKDYSESLERWYISVVPYSVFGTPGVSKPLIFMYLSVIIALFTLFRCYKWFIHLRSNISRGMAKLSGLSDKNEERKLKKEIVSYLNGSGNDRNDITEKLGEEFANSAILMIRMDNLEELRNDYSQKDIELFTFGMDNIIRELLSGCGFSSIFLRRNANVLEYIISVPDDSLGKKYREFALSCADALKGYIGAETSYYISDVQSADSLRECYEEAKDILEYFFIYGEGCILDSSITKENSDIRVSDAKRICEDIRDSIIRSEHKEEEIYETLVNCMKEMSVSDIREITFYLLICLYAATETLREKNAIVTSFDVINSLTFASAVSKLSEFSGFVNGIFKTISEQKAVSGENRVYAMIKKSFDIIEEGYRNEDMCITYIAEKFGVTDNYLGRKFKEVTGKTIANVITEKRLTEASRLLIETDKNVKDIMYEVGYSNSSYFSAVFKKWYGVTPIQYRQNRE